MNVVANNSFFGAITIGTRFFTTTVLFIILARALGVEEFGRFTFAVSFTGIFLVVVDYGFALLVIRDVAASPKKALETATRVVNAKLLLSLLSTAALITMIKILRYPVKTELLIYVLWFASLLSSFGAVLNSIFKGLNNFRYEMYLSAFSNGGQLLLAVLLLAMGLEAVSVAMAFVISQGVYFLLSLRLVHRKLGPLIVSFNVGKSFKMLTGSLPFGMHAILGLLYFQIDTLFLAYFKGNTEVGYYQAAMRIVIAVMTIYDVIAFAYFPVIAGEIKKETGVFKKNALAFNRYMLLSGGALAVFLFTYADAIIKFLFGGNYASSVLIIELLSVVVFLRFLGGAYGVFITVSDHQGLRTFSGFISLIISIGLNIILVPAYGAIGAATAAILTHACLEVLYIAFSFRLTGSFFIDSYCYRGAAVLLIGLLSGLLFRGTSLLPLSLIVYMLNLLLLFFFALTIEERGAIKAFFGKVVPKETTMNG